MHAAFAKVAIFDHWDNIDTEGIDDGITKGTKKLNLTCLAILRKNYSMINTYLPCLLSRGGFQ